MPKPLDAALAARMRTISAPPGQTETRGCPSSAPVFKRTRGCSQAIFALWKSPTVARRQTIRNTSPDQPLRYADACSMRTQERDIDATCNRRYNCYNTLRQECRTPIPDGQGLLRMVQGAHAPETGSAGLSGHLPYLYKNCHLPLYPAWLVTPICPVDPFRNRWVKYAP